MFGQADLTIKRDTELVEGAVAGNAVTGDLGDLTVEDAGALFFNLKYRAFNQPAGSLKE